MKMLRSFVERITALDEQQLEKWFTDGLTAYHNNPSATYRRAENAFQWAGLSFGRGGQYSTAVDDLNILFEELSDTARNSLDRKSTRLNSSHQ